MSVVKQAWYKEGCGLFLYLFGAVMAVGLAYEFFFKQDEYPGRSQAVREFEMECVQKELGGLSWENLRKSDREEIATKCVNLGRKFRLEYGN